MLSKEDIKGEYCLIVYFFIIYCCIYIIYSVCIKGKFVYIVSSYLLYYCYLYYYFHYYYRHYLSGKLPQEYHNREADKLRYRYPGVGGESYLDVIERIRPVIIGTCFGVCEAVCLFVCLFVCVKMSVFFCF